MRHLTVEEVLEFEAQESACVSVYLSGHQGQNQSKAALIALKSLLKQASNLLAADDQKEYGDWILGLLSEFSNDSQWISHQGSTAIFLSKELIGYIKFPIQTSNLVSVSSSFHIKPLIQWKEENLGYYLCHLSQNEATLYRGSLKLIEKIATFGASSSTMENPKDLSEIFIKEITSQVVSELRNETKWLLISGSPKLCTLFEDYCGYPYLHETRVCTKSGKPIEEELAIASAKIVAKEVENLKKLAIDEFMKAKQNLMALHELRDIARASLDGRIKDLFISQDSHLWGYFDRTTGSVKLSKKRDSKDEDILDDIAEEVVRTSGRVFVIPEKKMPDKSVILATLRW